MSNKFIIHVGLPKTGTSALQSSLTRSDLFLQQLGVLYPLAGRGLKISHSALAKDINQNGLVQENSAIIQNMKKECNNWLKNSNNNVIISSEVFANIIAKPLDSHLFANMCYQLNPSKFNIEIIMFMRGMACFFESMYLQSFRMLNFDKILIKLSDYIESRAQYFERIFIRLNHFQNDERFNVKIYDFGLDSFDSVAVIAEDYGWPLRAPLEKRRNPRMSEAAWAVLGGLGQALEAEHPDRHRRLKKQFARALLSAPFGAPDAPARALSHDALRASEAVCAALSRHPFASHAARALSEIPPTSKSQLSGDIDPERLERIEAYLAAHASVELTTCWRDLRRRLPADIRRFADWFNGQ